MRGAAGMPKSTMSDSSTSREGGCRCGKVRFRISAAPLLTMACHCKGCQRMTSSAFSLSVAIPSEGFTVIDGEPVIGGLHGETRHFFCGWCMSWLFTRAEGLDWFVNVRVTMLDDDTGWSTPFIETCTDEKLPWVTTPALHGFPAFPSMDAYGELLEQYAKHAAAPAR
jgi:hypothetical protein